MTATKTETYNNPLTVTQRKLDEMHLKAFASIDALLNQPNCTSVAITRDPTSALGYKWNANTIELHELDPGDRVLMRDGTKATVIQTGDGGVGVEMDA
jgi:hypothetical protein